MCELVVREVEAEVGCGEILSTGGQEDRERDRERPGVVTLDVQFQNGSQRLLVSDILSCAGSVRWQPEAECTAFRRRFNQFDISMVLAQDAFTDREAEAGAAGAMGQEGLEYVGLDVFRDAGAVVSDDKGCLCGGGCTGNLDRAT